MKKLLITSMIVYSFSFLKGMEVPSNTQPGGPLAPQKVELATLLSRAKQEVIKLALEKYNNNGYDAFTDYLEKMPKDLYSELYNYVATTLKQPDIFINELKKLYYNNPEKVIEYWNRFSLPAKVCLAQRLLTKENHKILETIINSLHEPSLANLEFLFTLVQKLDVSTPAQALIEGVLKMTITSPGKIDLSSSELATPVESLQNNTYLTMLLNKQIGALLSKIQLEPSPQSVESLETKITPLLTQEKTTSRLLELVQDSHFEQLMPELITKLEYMILKKSCETMGTAKTIEQLLSSYLCLEIDLDTISPELLPRFLDSRLQLVEHLYNKLVKTYPSVLELNERLIGTTSYLYNSRLYTLNYLSCIAISLFAQAILIAIDNNDESRASLLAQRALPFFTDQVPSHILDLYGKAGEALSEAEEDTDEVERLRDSLKMLLKVYVPLLATHSPQSFSWLINTFIPPIQDIISAFFSREEAEAATVIAINEISNIKLRKKLMEKLALD